MIDWTKPIQTRSGLKAEFLTKLTGKKYPYVAKITKGGVDEVWCFRDTGRFLSEESPRDIINVPEKRVMYVNVYPGSFLGLGAKTRRDADDTASLNRIACVRVEYEEGQYDE